VSAERVRAGGWSAGNSSLVLWGIVFAGALLRLIALGHKSFWLDETASVRVARRAAPVFWHVLWHDEGNMALYYVLLKPWLHFGYAEGTVRLLSVIPGVLALPLMYLLGERLFGRRVGLLAATFLALNPCAIAVAQEARAYSFLVLAVVLSTYLFALLIEEPGSASALAYAATTALTCYFHYFGVLAPVAHAVSILALPAKRRPWKLLFLAWVTSALLASPILWLMHAQDVRHISWVQPPSLLEAYHLGVFLAANGGKAVGATLLALDLALVALFLGNLKASWRVAEDDLHRWRYTLVASSFCSPVLITLLISIVRPVFYHRYLIICLPAWILMTSLGAVQGSTGALRRWAFLSVCMLSLVCTFISYRRVTEDWRGVANYLIANAGVSDRVLYYQPDGQFAGESYRDWLPAGNTSRPPAIGIDISNSDWEREIAHAGRVWLVLYRARPNDAEARAIERELSAQREAGTQKNFRGIMVIEYKPR